MSENTYCFNCLVLGDVLDHIFSVKIASTETVLMLKDVIKDQKQYAFPAHQLNLYRTSEKVARWNDDDDDDGLMRAVKEGGHSKLFPLRVLSAAFDHPLTPNGLHVVVELPLVVAAASVSQPTLCLNCLILGDKPPQQRIFPVEISSTETVSILRNAIKDENQNALHDIAADQLVLYRTSLPNDGELENKLEHFDFNDICTLSPKYSPKTALKCIITSSKLSPSQATKLDDYLKIQEGDRKILDCRYVTKGYDTVALPIQLFNPAFAYFTSKAFDPEHVVPHAFIRDVRDLIESSHVIHGLRLQPQDYLKPIIQKIIGHPTIFASNAAGTAPDGMAVVPHGHTGRVHLVIYEEKSEFGGWDPSTQGAFSYRRMFCRKDTRALLLATCCPAFIIARAGPWLTILGGVITGSCIVQRLTDFLWLPLHSTHDDDHWLRIARIFYVLKESVERLRSWYEANTEPPYDLSFPVLHPRFFPSINRFPEGDVEVEFQYRRPLIGFDSCATYLARTVEACPKDIVVKFVTRYGGDVHQTMADAGFAPKLRYFGPIGIGDNTVSYGKLKMVVMDYVEGLMLCDALEQQEVPANFLTHLRQAVAHLHDAGFVFGDLREPNIMVTPDDEVTVRLIDFDWAGKDGEVLYPITISPDISWPKGVAGLMPIEKQHDLSNLAGIIDLCH